MIVAFIDRVLKLLDDKTARTAVISASADWKSAFDMIDPGLYKRYYWRQKMAGIE